MFVLTFAVGFFARHGFEEIEGTPVSHEVYAELLRSYDEGVAEFLDLGPGEAEHPGQHPDAAAPVAASGGCWRLRRAAGGRLPVAATDGRLLMPM